MQYLINALCLFKRFRPATTCSTTVSQPPTEPSTTAELDPVTYRAKHPPHSREYKLEVNYEQLSHRGFLCIGLQPMVPVSIFSPCYLIKSCEHDTEKGVGKGGKGGEKKKRERDRALCVPQRSINTLKALNPKSITITPSPGKRICLLLFHKTTNH